MPNTTMNTDAVIRAGLVPYITNWSGERPIKTPLVATRSGIGYRQEQPGDRDVHGVLWVRYRHARGAGKPEFATVHPYRQRRAMRRLLCQCCGGPADRNDQGILWLLGEAADRPWSGQESTAQPPTCLPCAKIASRLCPHLRGNSLALRVREAPIAGVQGTLYAPTPQGIVRIEDTRLPYDNPGVRVLVARQLFRNLLDCTVVDLQEELKSCR